MAAARGCNAFELLGGAGSAFAAVGLAVLIQGCSTTGANPVHKGLPDQPSLRTPHTKPESNEWNEGVRLSASGADRTSDVVYYEAATHPSFPEDADSRRDAAKLEPADITLNLAGTPVRAAAKTVLGDILHVNYTINPRVNGDITLQTTKAVTKAEIASLFQGALRASGAIVVKQGDRYAIEPIDQVPRTAGNLLSANEPGEIGLNTRVIPLKWVSALEMQRVLEPMLERGAILRADSARNSLMISASNAEMAAIADAVRLFDTDFLKGMSFAVIPIRSAAPDEIAAELRKIFHSDRDGPTKGMIRFLPNSRLQSILVISNQKDYLDRARSWTERLDRNAGRAEKQLYTYNVQNRSAKELESVVSSLFSASIKSQSPQTRAVAPQHATATLRSRGAEPDDGITAASSPRMPNTSAANATGDDQTSLDQLEQEAARPAADERVRITVDPSRNKLLILATDNDYQRIVRIVKKLDVPPNQVLIEAAIAEVSLNDSLKFGVRWYLERKDHSFSLTDVGSAFVDSSLPGFSYALSAPSAKVALNALNEVTHVNIVSTPSLLVIDNKTATLQIGDQVPIVTQSAIGVVTPNAPVVNSVNYRDTGVILSITPRVNDNGRVELNIEQEVSTVAATTTSTIDSPTIKQRKIKTTVFLKDGEALTLGGLMQNQVSNKRSQVPVLGDIPVIGNVFKEKGDTVDKTELIILLTPRVIRSDQAAREATEEYRNGFKSHMSPPRRGRQEIEQAFERSFN